LVASLLSKKVWKPWKGIEFYAKCLRSCSNADWSWLETFNWVY
jgi:hypothetical protein